MGRRRKILFPGKKSCVHVLPGFTRPFCPMWAVSLRARLIVEGRKAIHLCRNGANSTDQNGSEAALLLGFSAT